MVGAGDDGQLGLWLDGLVWFSNASSLLGLGRLRFISSSSETLEFVPDQFRSNEKRITNGYFETKVRQWRN